LPLRLLLHPRPSLRQKPVKMKNVKAAMAVVAAMAPAATSPAVSLVVMAVVKLALKAVADALKPVKRQVAVVHAAAVVVAVVAQTAQRKAKVSASVLTTRVALWTRFNRP
jgi:hypothetical protein